MNCPRCFWVTIPTVSPGLQIFLISVATKFSMESKMYSRKIIVAPMVRVCTLPFRLMAIDYGADLVYTEETIDFKMLRSVKKDNEILGTVDFVDKSDGTVFFRTCTKEQGKVIFQLGTCDPQRALKVGKMVEPYVAGLDVNMGCPKEFSIKGGMGAALLTQPEKVSCKFLFPFNLCILNLYCCHQQNTKRFTNLSSGGSKEITCYEDIERFRIETGAASVMLARAAMWNCSIIRQQGFIPLDEVVETYLRYCVDFDNQFTYSKYTVQNMLRELQDTPRGKAFLETQTLQEICQIWDLKEYFEAKLKEQNDLQKLKNIKCESNKTYMPPNADYVSITEMVENGQKHFEMAVKFIRGNFNNADLPKMLLNTHIFRKNLTGPAFTCAVQDKFFGATVEVDGIKYSSTLREKSRRYSEQAAAMVCLHVLKVVDKTYGFTPTVGARKYQHVIDDMKTTRKGEKRDSSGNNNSGADTVSEADIKKQKVKVLEANGSEDVEKGTAVQTVAS
ncbi:tRNA-dihydrouridine(20) synthase [NAD(P)+]-like [Macrobrachium nipponense]|uniref:tRNA-dihydrouridine(20) synthase [NAD(P)+]-like n=1 Tax=Macrobrachium nipponense TaxID=159736 RepID=UPI0030C86728